MLEKKNASPDRYGLLKDFARENRKYPTDAEYFLWQHIRGKELGVSFLRQYIIGDYIVDFACREDGLIIEVDGAYHSERTQQEDDELRTQQLESWGYRVIRFSNEEVLFHIDEVLKVIEKQLK